MLDPNRWYMRFFDATSRVTNMDLQMMWGKILAGETRRTGSFSLRTLDIVRNLSHDEAVTFDQICRRVMWSGNTFFLFENGFHELEFLDDGTPYNEGSRSLVDAAGLNDQDHMQPLVEAGLLTQDHRFVGTFKGDDLLAMGNEVVTCFVKTDADRTMIVFDPYMLTKSGTELFRAIANGSGFEPDYRYDSACIKELSMMYPNHQWTAFLRVGEDQFEQLDLEGQELKARQSGAHAHGDEKLDHSTVPHEEE